MKGHIAHSGSCSCTNCVYKSRSQLPSVQHLIETGSKIDRLYYGKYLPLRERKLLGKLIKTRAVYDDVRTQLLSASGSSDPTKDTQDDDSTERSSAVTKIVGLVDRGQIGSSGTSKLSNCCSCCSCSSMKKIRIDKPRVHRHSVPHEVIEKYNLEAKRKGRARRNSLSTRIGSKVKAVRIKAKRVRSAPCACTLDISSMFKRLSKPYLKRIRSKEMSTNTTEAQPHKNPPKAVTIDGKALKIKCLCNFKLGKRSMKSLHKLKRTKASAITGESEGTTGKRFRIRKDSVMLYRDKLKKRKELHDDECEPGICEPDKCTPEHCYKKIIARKQKKYPSKLSGTKLPQSHASIGTKRRVSNVNVGKRVKNIDTKCMCPAKTTLSKTTSAGTLREIKFQEEEPNVIEENDRLQTENKKSKSMRQSIKQTKKQKTFLCECLPNASEEESKPIQSTSVTSKASSIKSILTRKSMSQATKPRKKGSKLKNAAVCDCPPTTISLEGSQISESGSQTSKPVYKTRNLMRKSISHAQKQAKKRRTGKAVAPCVCPLTKTSLKESLYNKNILRQDESERKIEESQYSPEELQLHPSRQVVRIGSKFSFNIEFYKDKPSDNNVPDTHDSEVMYESSPETSRRTSRRIENRHRSSQSISSISKKNARTGHNLKRCFCTLKIPKRKLKPHRPPSRKTMTSLNIRNVDVVGRMRETQTKPFKHQGANFVYVSPPLTSKPRSLLPYECEPFFCTPGECDPFECEKRIRSRNRKGSKYLSRETNTLRKPKRSAVTLTTQYMSGSSKKNQSVSPKYRETKRLHASEIENPQLELGHSNRQGVRIGSSFSFNVEFSKEKISNEVCNEICNNKIEKPAQKKTWVDKKKYRPKGIKIHKPRLQHTISQTMKTEKSKHIHTKKGVDKCICPANILKEKSTVTPLEYTQDSSVLMRHISIETEKENIKHRNKASFLPYECEPGVCTPDECDPYECEKLIKMRNAKYRNESTCICPKTKSVKNSITKSVTSYSKRSNVNTRHTKSVRRNERDSIITPHRSGKQVVRIGSSFSFNVEFYKEMQPADGVKTIEVLHDKRTRDKNRQHSFDRPKLKETGVQESKRRAHDVSSSAEKRVKEKGISVSSAIKRCFCTLKLRNKDKLLIKNKEGNLHTSTPKYRRGGVGKRLSNIGNHTKMILKPNYCRAAACDHHECCRETEHRHKKHSKAVTDNNPNKMTSRSFQRRHTERNQHNYDQVYVREEQVIPRRVHQQSPLQAGCAGSFFDYNLQMIERRGHNKPSATNDPNVIPEITPKEVKSNKKSKVELKKSPVIKVKKEPKTLNLGLKFKNAMGSFKRQMIGIVVMIKKIKIRRSVSQYTMVKVKKPKHGELGPVNQPVTAAFFQVIRDVDREIKAKKEIYNRVNKRRSETHYYDEYSRTKVFSNESLYEESYQNWKFIQRDRDSENIYPDNYLNDNTSNQSISYESSAGFDLKSIGDTLQIKCSAFNQTRNNNENKFIGTPAIKSIFQHSYYALNVQVPYTFTKQRRGKTRNLEKFECEPGYCVPGECNQIECLKRINSRFKSTKSSETDRFKKKSVKNSTRAKFCTKCTTAQSDGSAMPKQKTSRGRSAMYIRPTSNEIRGSPRQSLSIGSNLSFKVEFYKQVTPVQSNGVHKSKSTKSSGAKNYRKQSTTGVHAMKQSYQSTQSQKSVMKENKGIGPVLKRCFCTLKLQKAIKETSCKNTMADEPFGNISLYQNQAIMTDKLKPYECAPGICIPGECDPNECYKLIQSILNKGRKTQSAGTDSVKMKSGHTKFDKKHTTRKTQSIAQRTHSRKVASRMGNEDVKVSPKCRQAVRFGSDINFNIEFFKERLPGDSLHFGSKGKMNSVKSLASKQTRNKSQGQVKSKSHSEANTASPKTQDAQGGTSLLKRCFCTLQLKKAGSKNLFKGVNNVTTEKHKNHGSVFFTNNKSYTCNTNTCHDNNLGPDSKGSKSSGKFITRVYACDENTCLGDSVKQRGKDIKSRRKRSKNTEVHKGKHDLSAKSVISRKRSAKAEKRLTRSFGCDLHTCNPDTSGPNELHKKQKIHSLKGVAKNVPDTHSKTKLIDTNKAKTNRLSLIKRCVCAMAHQTGCNRNDVSQIQNESGELKKQKSYKHKIKNNVNKEHFDYSVPPDIQTIMAPTKKSRKRGIWVISKRIIAADHETHDQDNGKPCRFLRKQRDKDSAQVNKDTKDTYEDKSPLVKDPKKGKKKTKPTKGKHKLSDPENFNLPDHQEMYTQESQAQQKGAKGQKSKTSKKNTSNIDSDDPQQFVPCNNNMSVDDISKTEDKRKTMKGSKNLKQNKAKNARANLVKTKRNGYSFAIHGNTCQCSHCAEGVNSINDYVKKRESKKKVKSDDRPLTNNSYHGLYPCLCSDKEINKKPSTSPSIKRKKDDGACPTCKHCKDKEPLLATLRAISGSLMARVNKIVTTMKCKREEQTQESPPDIPLFEMVVNKGDMSIMNKAEIIEKVKQSSGDDRHEKAPLSPSFEMVIDKSDASIKDTDEIRKKIMESAKPSKTPHSKKIKSKSLKFQMPMKPPVKGAKSERQAYSFQIHGKNCKCCYCASKGRRQTDSQPATGLSKNKAFMDGKPAYDKKTTKRGPCICGSAECKMEINKEMQDKLEEKKRSKQKPCVCGSKICGVESNKFTKSVVRKGKPKKKGKGKKKEKPKPKSHRPDLTAIGSLLCGKITYQEFKYKIRGKVETEHEKRERVQRKKSFKAKIEQQKRKEVYAKEDAKRRKIRIKNDKLAMKDVKRYKDTPDCLLCAESFLDVGKLGVSAVSGVLRTAFRAASDPKSSATNIKELSKDPGHAFRLVKEAVASSGVAGTATRIKQRIGAMRRTQACVAKMEAHPLTNYMVHFADKDPKKRLVKHREGKRVRVPLDFECSLFMGSLRKKPHLWVYYMCPWFYPHCISLVGVWRQFTDVLLFLLAVAVWSPCIFAMEACRALMCCFLCTG